MTGEAMTIGLPVVGTRVGGTESMVLDGETGYLVNVGDYQSLAEKVIDPLQHPQKSNSIGS